MDYEKLFFEIENLMQRNLIGRDNDYETVQNINKIMTDNGFLHFENGLKKSELSNVINSVCGIKNTGGWCYGCENKKICVLYNKT